MADPYTGGELPEQEAYNPKGNSNLHRLPGAGKEPPSPDPLISPSSSRNRLRNYLDDTFNIPDDPHASWEAKRGWIEDDARRQKPDITDSQLESVYKAYGLSRSPGDFDRGDDTWSAFSRSMSMAGESFGQLWDAAELKIADYRDDKEGIVENQRQLDESRWEQSLIAQFQSERSSNALTQFMFDLSSSAPLMVGMVAGGAAVAGLAGLAGAPVWLAGLLGYGVIDALVEGQFTFIDVVTDPHVRGKIEKAMGREMTDADIKAISSETQKHLMDHAKTAEDQTRVANFINPLNYIPFANKLNKLFKVGSAMKGTVRRGAANVAFREGIEEVGQSAVSQKFAGEAKMDALREFKYDPDPRDYDVDWGQAFYEGAMGFVTGAPIGMVSSYRAGKRWERGQINIDEATGRPIFKDKGEEGFVGKGPLELSVRSIVDSDMPVADKLEGLDRLLHSFKKDGDSREQDILRKEIERMREGKPLMMDKADQEALSKRKQELAEFKEGKHYDPTKDPAQQDTTGQQESLIVEPDQKKYSPQGYQARIRELLSQANPASAIQKRLRMFLNTQKDKRTPYQKQFIQFALDPINKELDVNELKKKTNKRINEETLQPFELSPEEAAVYKAAQAKQKRFEKADEQLKQELGEGTDTTEATSTMTEAQILEKARSMMEQYKTINNVVLELGDNIETNLGKELADIFRSETERISAINIQERQAGEAGTKVKPPATTTSDVIYGDKTETGTATETGTDTEAGTQSARAATGTPAITEKETDKSATATEIVNQLKQWWDAAGNKPKTEAEWRQLNTDIRKDIDAYGEANFDAIWKDKQFKTDEEGQAKRKKAEEKGELQYKDWNFDVTGKSELAIQLADKHNIPVPEFEGQAGVRTATGATTEEVADTEAVETDKDAPPTLYNADNNEVKPKLNVDKVIGLKVYHYKPNKTDKGRTYILTERQYTAVQKGGDRQVENEVLSAKKDYTAQLYTFWGMDGDTPVFTRGARRSDTKMGRTVDIKDAPNPLINKPKLAQAMLDHLLTGSNESFAYPTKKKGEYGWKFQTATDEDIPAVDVDAAKNLYKRMQEFGPKVNALAAEEQKMKAKFLDDKGKIKKGQLKSKYTAAKKKIDNKHEALRKEAQEIVDEQHRIGFGLESEKARLQTKDTKPRKVKDNLEQATQEQIDNDPMFRDWLDEKGIKWEFSEKKQGEMLGESITRPPQGKKVEDEPQAGEVKKTAIVEAELAKKREELAASAATREADAVEEGLPMQNWRRSAREKMAKYNSSKLADGLTTTKALEKLRSHLTGEQKNLSDEELLEFLWSKEGRGTKGTPNIASVGNESGQSRDAMTLNQVEATLKNKQNEDPKVYNPKWTKSEKPYKKLAMDFINKEEAPVRPPSGKGKPEVEEYIDSNGNKYVGELKDGKRHGQGTVTSPDGDKYVGEFKHGIFHGQGTYTWHDGRKYVGAYKDGERHGQGTRTSPNGDKYVGEWKDGKKHGKGTFTWSDGDKYVGEFKDGKQHGQGTYTFSNGEKYVGEWKDAKRNGQGTHTFPNGDKYVGKFKDGVEWSGTSYGKDGNTIGIWSKGKHTPSKTEAKKTPTKETATDKMPDEENLARVDKATKFTDPTLTVDEIKDLLAKNGKEDLIKNITDEKGNIEVTRYSDLTAWDTEEYTSSEDFANEIKTDLGIPLKGDDNYNPKTDKSPSKLMKEIREKLAQWLIDRANLLGKIGTGGDAGPLSQLERAINQYWGLFLETDRKRIMNAYKSHFAEVSTGRHQLEDLPISSKKFFDLKSKIKVVKKKPRVGPPKSPLSQVAVSATTRVPYTKEKKKGVWFIIPSEVTSIFGGATQDWVDSLNQKAPFIITDIQNTWRMYTIDPDTGLFNPKPLVPPTALTTGAKGLKQDPARLASRKDPDLKSHKLNDNEIRYLMLLEGSERIENRMMDEGLLPLLKLKNVERNLDDIEKIIETVPGDQLWATDYGDKTVEFVEYKDGGRENTTIRFKTDKDAKNFVQRVMQGNPNSAELEQASFGMDKAQQYKEHMAEHKEEEILRRGRESNIDDAEMDELISYARNIADNQGASILTHNNNIGWSQTNYNESVLEELRATKGVDAAKEYLERQNKGEDLDPKDLQFLATKSDTVTLSADAKKPTIEEIKNVVFEFNKKHPGIINNLSLVVDPNHPVSKDKRGIKGAYQESTDTIILVANNLSSKADVALTLFHEGVGHRSYKNPHTNILTTETRAELEDLVKNSFPDEYAHEVGEQLKALDKKEAQLEPNMDRDQTAHTRAAQEVLAHKIETMTDEDFNPTFVEKLSYWIRKVIRDFLEGIGIGTVILNNNDVKVLYSRLAKDLKKVTKPMSELDIGRLSKLPEDVMYRADLSIEERFNGFDVNREQAIFLDKVYPVYDKGNTVSIMKRLWQSFNHKVFDPYLVIKREVGIVPYMVARLSNRADGILTTILQHAGVKVEKEKVDGILVSNTVLDRSKKSFNAAIKPLGTETERKKFFAWMAAKRAAILKGENPTKEQYFSDAQIRDGVTLNTGTMKDATTGVQGSRQQIYNRVSNDIAALNDSMVKLGIDMGLFNTEYAKQWQTAFYVPFYRHFETQIGDNQFKGAANYNSLVNQKGVYELHGSEKGITDPMNNLLHNWLHIIDASIKNHSAKVVMDKASGMIDPVTSLPTVQKVSSSNARSVRILRDGKEEHYVVNNQLLFDSLTTLSNDSKFPMFGLGIKAKNIFTRIITSSPVFKFWSNIIRDTMGAAGTTDLGFNLWKNAVGGFRSLKDVQADMLVTGGYIQFGNIRSDDPNYAEKILGKELTSGYIVANPEKNEKFQAALKKGWKMMGSVWRSYEKLGDKMENANRAALFNATLSKSKSKLKAAFEARDLMDFTLHGASKWVRTLTSIMPFSNAMLQGKYKLARSTKEHSEAVATLAGMTILVSLFEYFMWGDDEDWDSRPDWDKDSYFQVKIPGTDTRFKIPKPHEFAMVGNLAWRGIDMARKNDPVHGELLASAVRTAVFREFDTTPLPHFIKPFVEIGMNENLYFNKPIESKGMQHLSPENRKSLYTSDTAGLISGVLQNIPNVLPFAESAKLSPVQIDHVANAYFGYLGGLVLTATDAILRMAGTYPDRPARPISEHPYVRKVITTGKLRNTKYAQMYYDRLAEADQAYADLQYYQRLGQFSNYTKLYNEKRDLLAFRKMIRGRRRDLNDLNARIKYNATTTTRGAEQKAVIEDRLYGTRNLLYRIISTWPSLR